MKQRNICCPVTSLWMALNISFFGLFLSGCATVGSKHYTSPPWWDDPIKKDSGNYFFAATGTSTVSVDEAFKIAQSNALDQILERLEGALNLRVSTGAHSGRETSLLYYRANFRSSDGLGSLLLSCD